MYSRPQRFVSRMPQQHDEAAMHVLGLPSGQRFMIYR